MKVHLRSIALASALLLTTILPAAGSQEDGTISGRVLTGAQASGEVVRDSVVNTGNVRDSDLYGVRLRALTIDDTRIENAAASNLTIRGSTVVKASLYQVTIERSDVREAWLERGTMTGGSLTDSSVREVTLNDVRLCNVLFIDEGRVDTSGCGGTTPTPTTPPPTRPGGRPTPPTGGRGELVLMNGGDTAPGFTSDGYPYRGKLFPDARSGTVTQICTIANWGGTAVFGVKERPDASPPQFTETLTTERQNDWTCKNVSHRFRGDSLFIYKISGDGLVAYDSGTPADSWYSNDNGQTWQQDNYRRGYRVTILPD